MPKLSKKARQEWSIFIGKNGRRQYNTLCRKCRRDCKQSYQAIVLQCPKYESKRKTVR
jgi:hypothetical protein